MIYQALRSVTGAYHKGAYINVRKQVLNHLKTQHLFLNLEIQISDVCAFCQLNAVIYRQNDTETYFNLHVIYNFSLVQFQESSWKLKKIKQFILWGEGDPSIQK